MLIDQEYFKRKTKEDSNGCWIWQGCQTPYGYGEMKYGTKGRARAHRVAYEVLIGPIPSTMFVLHTCDNPSCVNPEHLKLGTAQDNMSDKVAKGRMVVHNGKLTADLVKEIRASTAYTKALAKMFGVSERCIWLVKTKQTWKHV